MVKKTGVGVLLSLVFVLFTYSSAVAEWYVGGAVGVAMPHDVDDLSASSGGYTLGISEFSPDTSFTGGAKVGYFFEQTPYLGVEINWSISEPDVDKETVTATITGTPTGVYAGQTSGEFLGSVDVDSLSSFAFLAMLRATDEDAKAKYNGIQPYLGLGFTVSTLDVNSVTAYSTAGALIGTGTGDSTTDVGFALTGGLNYLINNNIKTYIEYQFGSVDYEFGSIDGLKTELTGQNSSLMFGASYSF
jgi:opacity protein-like surface antigen|tara:strand:- start:42 stop:779 length:738 start_codon:yes stop_codon:yes gene_type:complete